jgi:hypothetical protein
VQDIAKIPRNNAPLGLDFLVGAYKRLGASLMFFEGSARHPNFAHVAFGQTLFSY